MPITNYLPSSRLIQPGVCTSTTRPATPFEGQYIYETDTDKTLFWNGTAWYPNWNTAWGFVAQNTLVTSVGYITTPQDIISLTFNAVANRRYRYTASGLMANNAIGVSLTYLTNASNTVLREHFSYYAASSSNYISAVLDYIETINSTGSVTRKIRHGESSPSGVYYYGSDARDSIAWKIRVEDIGPA